MNGEFIRTADYHLHTGKLNTARGHAQDLPKLFLLVARWVKPFGGFVASIAFGLVFAYLTIVTGRRGFGRKNL